MVELEKTKFDSSDVGVFLINLVKLKYSFPHKKKVKELLFGRELNNLYFRTDGVLTTNCDNAQKSSTLATKQGIGASSSIDDIKV